MDLVKRLRDQEAPTGHGVCQNCDGNLRDEAADKIEQLQREVLDRDKVEYALRKEVERLKSAIDSYEADRLSRADCNNGF